MMEDFRVEVTREIAAPVADVWATVGDFGNVSWAMPDVKVTVNGSGVGMVRTMHMPGSDPVDEILEAWDAEAHSFGYAIPGVMPMPVSDFRGWVKLEPVGTTRTHISWNASGKALPGLTGAEGQAIFEGLYTNLLNALEAHLALAA